MLGEANRKIFAAYRGHDVYYIGSNEVVTGASMVNSKMPGSPSDTLQKPGGCDGSE